jgi:rhodanese-related sulfurtransferase
MFAKFIPGFASVSTAMAGAVRLPYWKFLLFDLIGALLWVGVAVGLGWVFRDAIGQVMDTLQALGKWGLVLLGSALALYIARRWWQRRAFIQQLRMDRVGVDELKRMQDENRVRVILDVRSEIVQKASGRIPGARPVDMMKIAEGLAGVERDGEVVVYCACPNEASAVKVAEQLRKLGFKRVRPLEGGIDAWIDAGHDVEF